MEIEVSATGLLFGALGLFYYGMKSLSYALQGAVGDSTFTAVGRLKGGPLKNACLGSLASLTVNSSALTVVTMMGLVNAGITTLGESLGLILGANLGTTFYPWLLSFLPYEAGLYMLGLGILPGLVSHNRFAVQLGRMILAFGMLLLGLGLLEKAVEVAHWPFISLLPGHGGGLYFLAGFAISAVFRSSLAAFALIVVFSQHLQLPFNLGLAYMMGANLGPSLYPWWLGRERSVYARRVALAHLGFNLTGALMGLGFILIGAGPLLATPMSIALAHVGLNLAPALFFLGILPLYERLLSRLVPDDPVREQYKLAVLGHGADLIPATAISQVKLQVEKQKDIVDRMLERTYDYIRSAKGDARAMAKIKDYERICDNISHEVTDYIVKLMEKPLDSAQSVRILALARASKELESISDYLDKMAIAATDLDQEGGIDPGACAEVLSYFEEVRDFYLSIVSHLDQPQVLDYKLLREAAFDLRKRGEVLRRELFEDLIETRNNPTHVRLVTDLVLSLRKIRGHVLNLAEALERVGQS